MDKVTKAITRLNLMTQQQQINWAVTDPPDRRSVEGWAEVAYETTFEGQRLRLYRRHYQAMDPDIEQYVWSYRGTLEVLDDKGRRLYEFPHNRALNDLLETVEFQTSNVGPLLDKLAGEA